MLQISKTVVSLSHQTQTKTVMSYSKHFSKSTVNALAKKGVTIIGATAIPAFLGDEYFSGTGYKLDAAGTHIIRDYFQVVTMAKSSWTPENLQEA